MFPESVDGGKNPVREKLWEPIKCSGKNERQMDFQSQLGFSYVNLNLEK
jgi:hypothetical protein